MTKIDRFKENAKRANYPSDYEIISTAIIKGDMRALEEHSTLVDDFPNGKDHFLHRNWITNAIDCGNLEVVKWMLEKGVSINFRDDEGYTVLHSAIEREESDKYDIMEALLIHGADVNRKGSNDWTPSHMAAVCNDIEALIILKKFGADFTIRTAIDNYTTPIGEAEMCGAQKATLDWFRVNGTA